MSTPTRPKEALERTYNAAASEFDLPPLSFWDRYGRRTVERVALQPGMKVLDACCGMGASAIPAAQHVGPHGHVIAFDLANRLLDKGTQRAAALGLTNIEFLKADLEHLTFPAQSFDAVLCVFGIFFVPNLHGAVRDLWSLVKPGGTLALTIWARGLFEPADPFFWEAVKREDPQLHASIKSWSKIFEPGPLCDLLRECGVPAPEAILEPGWHPLHEPEDWWTIILGSGYRSTVDSLSPAHRELVRQASIEAVRQADIRQIRTDVVYATARKLV